MSNQPAIIAIAFLILSLDSNWAPSRAGDLTDHVADKTVACSPIGRTDDGKLIYPLTCESVPRSFRGAIESGAAEPTSGRWRGGGGLLGLSSGYQPEDGARGPAVPPSPN